jgi:alpha-galactosidase
MKNSVNIFYAAEEIAVTDFASEIWQNAEVAPLAKYWSGKDAPPDRRAQTRLIWTDAALFVRFDCHQFEPFVMSEKPDMTQKTNGLWERDVCEIFVAPDTNEPERYFEFEAAPNGAWLDLAIRQLPDRRETDFNFDSGMTTGARIAENSFTIILRVAWQAFGRMPTTGDKWRANLFRCVGAGETRGYLTWQPTLTDAPNFHVPAAFGWLEFIK